MIPVNTKKDNVKFCYFSCIYSHPQTHILKTRDVYLKYHVK